MEQMQLGSLAKMLEFKCKKCCVIIIVKMCPTGE